MTIFLFLASSCLCICNGYLSTLSAIVSCSWHKFLFLCCMHCPKNLRCWSGWLSPSAFSCTLKAPLLLMINKSWTAEFLTSMSAKRNPDSRTFSLLHNYTNFLFGICHGFLTICQEQSWFNFHLYIFYPTLP